MAVGREDLLLLLLLGFGFKLFELLLFVVAKEDKVPSVTL